ncbi:uncharacterized protein LOC144134412 [Amblyomma americanum]
MSEAGSEGKLDSPDLEPNEDDIDVESPVERESLEEYSPDAGSPEAALNEGEIVLTAEGIEAGDGVEPAVDVEAGVGIEGDEGIEVPAAARDRKFYRAMDSIMVAKHDKPRRRVPENTDSSSSLMAFCVAGGLALVIMAICTVSFVIVKMMIGVEQSYDFTFAEASMDPRDYADDDTGQNTSQATPEMRPENTTFPSMFSWF